MYAGYRFDINEHKGGLYASLLFNPMRPGDETAPVVSLAVRDTLLSLSGATAPQRSLLSLHSADEPGGSGLGSWILGITTGTYQGAPIVRTYAGGTLPPSSLFWEMKSSQQDLVAPGTYFVELVCVDRAGNLGRSGWYTIRVIE
jgi:hypothetical protein